ncbi:MAG TPA: hypothetical protein V6C65_26155 [Allocoleopsis sp.]
MAGSSIKEAMEKAQHDKYAKEIKELVELTGSLYEPTDMALMDEAAELRNEINKLELKLEVQRLKEKRDNLRKQLNYKG